jgi:hypothetical protein
MMFFCFLLFSHLIKALCFHVLLSIMHVYEMTNYYSLTLILHILREPSFMWANQSSCLTITVCLALLWVSWRGYKGSHKAWLVLHNMKLQRIPQSDSWVIRQTGTKKCVVRKCFKEGYVKKRTFSLGSEVYVGVRTDPKSYSKGIVCHKHKDACGIRGGRRKIWASK